MKLQIDSLISSRVHSSLSGKTDGHAPGASIHYRMPLRDTVRVSHHTDLDMDSSDDDSSVMESDADNGYFRPLRADFGTKSKPGSYDGRSANQLQGDVIWIDIGKWNQDNHNDKVGVFEYPYGLLLAPIKSTGKLHIQLNSRYAGIHSVAEN